MCQAKPSRSFPADLSLTLKAFWDALDAPWMISASWGWLAL